MTVESNYVIAIATLNDWLKRLAPVFPSWPDSSNPVEHCTGIAEVGVRIPV